MAHYSVRVTRDKIVGKLKEKDLKEIKEEAIAAMYKLIRQHIVGFDLSKPDGKLTVFEFDIDVNSPKTTRDKEYASNIELI
ncbi:hypothetical protein [Staphylococcus agnetis]|uniref:hypothetical protein n=1 Tax=Staphylococcus agnetis TaxID=985762 RepID=UPI0039E875C5